MALLGALVVLAAAPSAALANHSQPEDSATGRGDAVADTLVDPDPFTVESFDFSARNYDDFQDAHGHMTLREQDPLTGAGREIWADVECLSVMGSPTGGGDAEISGRITRVSGSGIELLVGDALKFQVTDGGETGADLFRSVVEASPESCAPSPGLFEVSGQIQVVDDPPLGSL